MTSTALLTTWRSRTGLHVVLVPLISRPNQSLLPSPE